MTLRPLGLRKGQRVAVFGDGWFSTSDRGTIEERGFFQIVRQCCLTLAVERIAP